MTLIHRISKLEEKAPGCSWCAKRTIWMDDQVKVVDGRHLCICPKCGKDRTDFVKIVSRKLWEELGVGL